MKLQQFADKWKLELEGDFFETPSSTLQHVIYKNKPAVLKIFKPNSDEKNSANILTEYAGQGAVKVYESSEHAILLERVIPGDTLTELVVTQKDSQATSIFCDVASSLHATKYKDGCAESVASLSRAFARYKASANQIIQLHTLEKAETIYTSLCNTQKKTVLLHGDLHHDNILHDAKRGWLSIDPKGYIGEAEFEVAAFLKNPKHNCYYADEKIVNSRIEIISNTMKLDAERILLWGYSYYVISTIWGIEDGDFNPEWLTMLQVLEQMIS